MKNNNFFWVSFSDLMTSLFFVMMVLFAVTIGYLQFQTKATKKQLETITELQTAVQQLPDNYFKYQKEYKRYNLNRQIRFRAGSATINPSDEPYLIEVGNSINELIISLDTIEEYKKFDIKYLIVIEGMASIDRYYDNFGLSYKRALSLYNLWKQNNIIPNQEICEIQIAGSGTDGVREFSGMEETRNQQFLIHIVPKIGEINFEDKNE